MATGLSRSDADMLLPPANYSMSTGYMSGIPDIQFTVTTPGSGYPIMNNKIGYILYTESEHRRIKQNTDAEDTLRGIETDMENYDGTLKVLRQTATQSAMVFADFEFNFEISDNGLTRSSNTHNIKKYPEGMNYAQSIYQAFYFIEDILINGQSIEDGSWVLAYNNDVLVGARQWRGNYTDIPAMGYDSYYETAGYLSNGDKVVLKVLDPDGDMHILQGDINLKVWKFLVAKQEKE